MLNNEGYKLVEIHEVHHYKLRETYDAVKKTGGIFTEYINNSLKLKQEASGYPHECQTDEQKDEFIRNYNEKNGNFFVKILF
jgi:hypothetical protein